ncbi:ricin-type beta-trefoil lectin domain protein [Dactylosporangium sp. NPDC049525]|uniref:ricin-type beta-trefoil lectin domain protein n=1 Tax=Dactylosporangium sp. NPDC049525 TaxID=3154730 RepID=UPI00342CC66B
MLMAVTFGVMRPGVEWTARQMTCPDAADAGTVGPEIDEEPLLIRPYVRHLEHQHAPRAAEEPMGDAPTPAGQSEYDGRHVRTPTDIRLTHAGAAVGMASAPATHRVNRVRWHFLAVGSAVLVLTLGATALALSVGDRPAAPAPGAVGTTTPGGGHFRTAAVPVPPASPASDTPPTAGASSGSGEPSPPGASTNPPPSGSTALIGQPALSPPSEGGGGSSTGRITSVSGLCLDGNAGPNGDGIRRWDCNGTSGQAWTVADGGTIQALGRCLQASGDQVRLQSCDGGPAQQWRSGPAGSLISQASGLCLGGPGDADSRAPQRMAACNQSDAQRWILL